MSEQSNDQQLINAVCSGSAAASDDFILRYRPLVAGLAASRFKYTPEQIDDLFQQIILLLWDDNYRLLRAWRGRGRFSTYLSAIVLHHCLKRQRQQRRQVDCNQNEFDRLTESDQPLPDEQAAAQAEQQRLQQALRQLKPRDRLMIYWRYYHDATPAQIGRILGLSGGAARKALFDALRRLRRRYEQQ
ncbi:MAG: hypothetical protein Tsb002_14930 [Wenzhouxiangellaceae bacterium]